MENKKVLIISYYWPPSAGSGVQRWLKFSKYLPALGWETFIYTPENPDFDIQDDSLLKDINKELIIIKKPIWEPYKIASLFSKEKKLNAGRVEQAGAKKSFFKSGITWIRGNLFIPDPRKFWIKPSIKFLTKYISDHQIKNIISTGPPHSMHLIAKGVKEKIPKINWIADFRDPLSNLDMLDTFSLSSASRRKYKEIEKSILDKADTVVTVTPGMKDDLLPFDHSKMVCITNGFDEEDFEGFVDRSDTDKVVIYHAGVMNLLRNPTNLWMSLNEIAADHPEFKAKLCIHLVGNIDPRVLESFDNYEHLKDCFLIEGYKTHDEIVRDYEKANVLLLLLNNSKAGKGSIPGKTFEYLATGKKIISFGDLASDANQLLQNIVNTINFEYYETVEIKLLTSFLSKSSSEEAGNSKKFSRRDLTFQFTKLLVHS